MKVYIVMKYYSEEYHVYEVFANKYDAQKIVDEDLMKFDYIEEREVKGTP